MTVRKVKELKARRTSVDDATCGRPSM